MHKANPVGDKQEQRELDRALWEGTGTMPLPPEETPAEESKEKD